MNETKAIKQFLLAVSIMTLFAFAAVIVCSDQDVDAVGPAIEYVDYASDSSANPPLRVYISGLDPVADLNKNVDYVLSGPESDFNRTKIRNIDESGLGFISITGLSSSLIKGNYTISVSNCDDDLGFRLYRLNLIDEGSSGFADKTVIISDHRLTSYHLSDDYSWNTEEDGTGAWISSLDSSMFVSYSLTLYAFEKLSVTFTGESGGVAYDGNPHSLTGIVDDLDARYSYSGLSYLAKGTDVGSYPGEFSGDVVIVDTYHDDMDVTALFDITYVTGTLTITGGIIVTAPEVDPIATVYDGEEHSTEIPDGEYYYVEQASGTSAGTYQVTFILKNKASYIWKSTGLSDDLHIDALTIAKAAPVYTEPTAKGTQTYTGEPLELIDAGTSTTPGTFTYSFTEAGPYGTDVPTGTDAGTYAVWFKFTPDDADDYESVGATLVSDDIRIIMGYVTVTVTGNTDSKVYNGEEHTVSGFTHDYSEGITVTLKEGAYAIASGTDADTYYMGLDESMFEWTSDDYVVTGFIVIDGSLTITKKEATITVDDNSKVYGEDDPELTGNVEGLVSEDDLGIITYHRAVGESVGEYEIDASYTDNSNYSVTVDKGTFTITANAIDKPTAEVGLVYNGKEQTGVPSGVGYDLTGDFKATVVGVYSATATLKGGYIWSDDSTEPVVLEWSISRKDMTVTADNKGKVVGASDPVLTATVDGLVDEYVISYSLERESGEGVGEYTITASGDAIQGNYSVTFKNGIFKITVGIPVDKPTGAVGLIYNAKEQTGVPSGEGYVLSGTYAAINSGEYTATATLEDGYIWSDDSTEPIDIVWSIGKKEATVTADDDEKVYGDVDPVLTATVTGLIGEDTLSYTISRVEGEAIGTYDIIPAGDETQGNYLVSYVQGVFKILPIQTVEKPKAVIGLIYDGKEQTGVPSGDGYTLSGYKAVDADNYVAVATLSEGCAWSDDTTDPIAIPWSIGKKALDNSMLTVSGEFTYDGKEHTISYTVSDKSDDKEIITADDYTVTSGDKGTNAGQYTLILDATEDGNYYGQMSAAWSIAQRAVTITVYDDEKVYGEDDPEFDGSVEGLVSEGDLGEITFERKAGEGIGDYEIFASYEENLNYDVTVIKGTLTITPREATVTAVDIVKAYGEDDPDLTATVEGVIDDFAIVYKLSREEGEDVGTYDITPSGEEVQGNYIVTFMKGKLTIVPAEIDRPVGLIGLIYNGSLQTGVESGEGYTLKGETAVNAGDYTALAILDGNHIWTDGSSEDAEIPWSIAQKEATVTADDKTKAYGEDDPELTAKVEGIIDEYALSYTISREKGEDVGTYAIIPSGEESQGNYSVTFVNGTFTITVTEIDKPEALIGLVYNGTPQSGVPSGTGYTLKGETAVNAGDYTALAILDEGYMWADGTTEAAEIPWSIAKKALDNGMVTVSGEYTYDGTEQTVSYTVSDKSAGEEIITSADYSVTSGDKGTNAGQYGLILDANEDGNYCGQMSAMWSIAQKAATVTADDKTKTVGSVDPEFTVTVDGVIDNYAIVYTISREVGESVGTYTITPSGEKSQGNYDVTFVSGTLTIVAKAIDKPTAKTGLVYNGSEQTGVKSGEGYTLKGEIAVNAGDYVATATLDDGYTWSDGSSDPAAVEWSIAQKAATVTADDKEKVFGAQDPALTATVDGVIDNYALVYTLSRAAGEAVGTYAITVTGDASQGNYAVTYKNGTLSIVYEERTVVDDKGRSSVDGQIAPGTVLVVTDRYEPSDWEGVDLSGKDIRGKYDIKLENATMKPFTGELEITLEVGSDLNGVEVTVYHHGTNGIEQFIRTVQDGKVTVTVSDLSPFIVAHANSTEPSGSGIDAGLIIGIVVIVLIVIVVAVVIYKKKTA